MIVKRTRGNQISIPVDLLRLARLTDDDRYFDAVYEDGVIKLNPVEITQRVPPEAYEALLGQVFNEGPGDVAASQRDAARVLPARSRKR